VSSALTGYNFVKAIPAIPTARYSLGVFIETALLSRLALNLKSLRLLQKSTSFGCSWMAFILIGYICSSHRVDQCIKRFSLADN
jgi:hypothetical protein